MWTEFDDMHSGGGTKVGDYEHIFIELPEFEARAYFETRFGEDPFDWGCSCCGPNFDAVEVEHPSKVSTVWTGHLTVEQFLASDRVLVIPKSEIGGDHTPP